MVCGSRRIGREKAEQGLRSAGFWVSVSRLLPPRAPPMFRLILISSIAACLAACNAPEPNRNGRGTDATEALVVVSSDYQSSNVSLLGFDGSVLTPSILHSGSVTTGLSAALSGDVVLPTSAVSGSDIVLVDRVPDAVLTWLDARSARVRAQLPVGTGLDRKSTRLNSSH